MIFMSLNLRGIRGSLKSTSFRRALNITHPNIIFIQETMVLEHKSQAYMQKFRPSWVTCAVSLVGSSGGILVSWDPLLFKLVHFLTRGRIFLSGSIIATKKNINFLNIYRPCLERKAFWTTVSSNNLLSLKNLLVVGDLNLTVST
jgi:hypothetical protein